MIVRICSGLSVLCALTVIFLISTNAETGLIDTLVGLVFGLSVPVMLDGFGRILAANRQA